MRVALLIVLAPAVAWAAPVELSFEAGANWVMSCAYTCPTAPQVALRVGYQAGQRLSLGLRAEGVLGPDGGGIRGNPGNNSRAILGELQIHSTGFVQVTGAAALGAGEIVRQHGDRDVEIGEVHGGPLFLYQLALGLRIGSPPLHFGLEGRLTGWLGATREGDSFLGPRGPATKESEMNLSLAAVLMISL